MKIYTKTGDAGETALFGGQRVGKEDIRIDACGTVDELNAFLGRAITYCTSPDIRSRLVRVQGELFQVGADLATPLDAKTSYITRLDSEPIRQLEADIDEWEAILPPLTSFILPGGSQSGAELHIARTVCRRAERRVVSLARAKPINEKTIIYLNRLSDWLFVLARMVNHRQNVSEAPWKP